MFGRLRHRRSPLAIVLEPSRDLAQQTFDELERFSKYLPEPGLRKLVVVGGQNSREQEQALDAGVDIIVGTVGRLAGTKFAFWQAELSPAGLI